MAIKTVPLADRMHSAISNIRLTEPDKLLEDGRILRFLSRMTTCCTGGRCAWELLFTSVATPDGVQLEAQLITHTSVPAAQRSTLTPLSQQTLQALLGALQACDVAASEAPAPVPPLRSPTLITLCRQGSGLLSEEAELTAGRLRQHLCTRAGNGLSLLLVQSRWAEGEMHRFAAGLSEKHQAMLARDPVFDFAVTLWGPDARANAAWLQGLTLSQLAPCVPAAPMSYPVCLRSDPWRLMTLLPAGQGATRLTLSELLTICGCPSEPGEMQRMCRTSWREHAAEALREAEVALLPMDMPLQPDDLRYLGLTQDGDLENALHMSRQMADMLRMCVAILRKLGTLSDSTPREPAALDRQTHMTGLLLPTVGHIYEQFVRECCYETMYCPYYAYATGRRPQQVVRVFLSCYDLGPGARGYRLQPLPQDASEPAVQNIIRERMIDDFTAYAAINGQRRSDDYWYELFNDMTTARSQRNGLTHELANLRSAESFARAFLLDRPGCPSLLRRLLLCRHVVTDFPVI